MDQFGKATEQFGLVAPHLEKPKSERIKRKYTKKQIVEPEHEVRAETRYQRVQQASRRCKKRRIIDDCWKRIHDHWINEDRDAAAAQKITNYYKITREEIDLSVLIDAAESLDSEPKQIEA